MARRGLHQVALRSTLLLTLALFVFGFPTPVAAVDPPPRMNQAFGDCVPATEAAYISFNSSNWQPGTSATLVWGASDATVAVPGDGILDLFSFGELFNDVWPTTLEITGIGIDGATYVVESPSIPDPGCGRRFTIIESYCDPSLGKAIRFESRGWQVAADFYHITIAGERVASAEPNGVYRNATWPATVLVEADLPIYPALDTLESPPLSAPPGCTRQGPQGHDKLTSGERYRDAALGSGVAIDGDFAVVGAPGAGGAYVFTRSGENWIEQAQLIPADGTGNLYGAAVAIDGTTVIVGAPAWDGEAAGGGAAYLFTRSGDIWTERARLTPSDPQADAGFGSSVAVELGTAVVGAPRMDAGAVASGAAYVFTASGTSWSQQQKLAGSDTAANGRFGHDVALSADTAVIGSPSGNGAAGAAYVFTRDGTTWSQQAKLASTFSDDLGYAVAIDGDVALAGAPSDYNKLKNPGAVYFFSRNDGEWSSGTKLNAGSSSFVGDFFGYDVTVAGEVAAAGAPDIHPGSGFVYKFERAGAVWSRTHQVKTFNGPSPFFFGASVNTDGDRIIVGDPLEGPDGEGAAYVYGVGAPADDPPEPPPPPPPPPPDESDPLSCDGIPATITGTDGNDTLVGTAGDDVIAGGDGDDVIRGLGGDDLICGGGGDDEIYGGPGNDTMYGDAGNDLLRGFRGNDLNYGGSGEDRIQDGPGSDMLWGGADKDKLWGGIGPDQLWGEGGNDQLHGNRDADLLSGGDGTDRIWGDSGSDTLFGDSRSDFLYGGIDDDVLTGGEGRDRLFGWSGADELYGEGDRDQLRGQEGDDLVNGGDDYDYCSAETTWIDCEKAI